MKLGKEYKKLASEILGCTLASYYNWDKQNRPIIRLLEKYFSIEDLNEFLEKEKITKLELIDDFQRTLSFEYFEFYSPENYSNKHSFPKKFYWDFIFRFKNEILMIDDKDAKEKFLSLIYEYQLIILKISSKINFSKIKVIKALNYFAQLFNEKDTRFIKYIISLIQHDFTQLNNNYYEAGALFSNENRDYKIKTISYQKKDLLLIPIETIKKLNTYDSYEEEYFFDNHDLKIYHENTRDKDFFEVYEDYLLKEN